MTEQSSFLGRGWSFPPTFTPQTKGVKMTTGQEDIEASLHILLTTRLNERVMRLDFGSNLDIVIFEPLSVNVQALIKNIIEGAILRHEPRITLLAINIDTNDEKEGILKIELEYTIRATNTRHNFVFPFYLNEATDATL